MPTLREKIDYLLRQRPYDEASLREHAIEIGLEIMYRNEMRDAYLKGEIPREKAVGILGPTEVDDLDDARKAVADDVPPPMV